MPDKSSWSTFRCKFMKFPSVWKKKRMKSTTSGEVFKNDKSEDEIVDDVTYFKKGRSSLLPDCPGLRMSGESNWSTDSLGSGNTHPEQLMPDCLDLIMSVDESNWSADIIELWDNIFSSVRTNKSTISSVSFKSERSKEVTVDFQKRQSSLISDCPGLRMSEESNLSADSFGSGNIKRKRKSEESSTNMDTFMIHQSKEDMIDFKKRRPSLIRRTKSNVSSTSRVSFMIHRSKEDMIDLKKRRSSLIRRSKSNVSTTSRESFKRNQLKGKTKSFKEGQSSLVPRRRQHSLPLSVNFRGRYQGL